MAGRLGPVVLALPEDMLSARAEVPDLPPARPALADVADSAVAALAGALAGAERPLVVPGGTLWSQAAADDLARFADAWGLPVAVPFRRQGHMDNAHPNYVGDLGVGMNPALGQALAQADCILALGTRLGDTLTRGYELMDLVRPHLRVIHVHPRPMSWAISGRPIRGWWPIRAWWWQPWRACPRPGAGTIGPGPCAPAMRPGSSPGSPPAPCAWKRWSAGFPRICRMTQF